MFEGTVTLFFFSVCRCGHCKRLKPEYAKAAEDLIRNDPPVILAKVDCTEAGKDTCNKFSVSGYPTLKIFKNGEFTQEYGGPRDAAGINSFGIMSSFDSLSSLLLAEISYKGRAQLWKFILGRDFVYS